MRRAFYISPSGDGHQNLAQDEYFLNTLGEEDFLLYLYINQNAVIIGKNQNAWKECNVAKMEAEGVQLVRRVSGGGAVYHDVGNVNFSFIAGEKLYNLERQLDMILSAVRMLGVEAEFSGRNDITAGGKKFSGNAFAARRGVRQHHGTLLIDTNLTKLSDYLNVPVQKIRAKGIESVRARVCNLKELQPELTPQMAVDALKQAYRQHYGEFELLDPAVLNHEAVKTLNEKHRSWEWRMGRTPEFDYEIETRFSWGGIQLCLSMDAGLIQAVNLYTDAMNPDLSDLVSKALIGTQFRSSLMAERLMEASSDPHVHELAAYLRSLQV